MRIHHSIRFIFVFLFVFPTLSPADQLQVTRVTDGDTIKAATDHMEITVRLVGIDAPEKCRKKREPGTPTLAEYVNKPFRIRGTYKGKEYTAVVNKSGTIRYDGKTYNSPSMAGKAARGRNTNGWVFWHYRNKQGEWVRLDELRR